ncbi:MAG: hypothetical protein ACI4J2_08190 [Ruminococcus sp.]
MKKLFSGLMLAVFVASYSVFFCGCGEAESSSSESHYFEESSQVSTKERETVNKKQQSKQQKQRGNVIINGKKQIVKILRPVLFVERQAVKH